MLHELFETVLSRQELSRAGELFSLEDHEVLPCAADVLCRIREAVSRQSYAGDDNAQSVVEICLTRVLTAIRDGRCVEQYCGELVSLLEACLQHELSPRARRSEHPPHAKVAADVMSCIFLHQPSSRALTSRSVGATVRFLHRGNRELARSVTRHLCLAASQNADLLVPHVQPVVDSIIAGNYALCKVLPSIYALRHREPAITDHLLALFSLLPQCEKAERLSLLTLFELMAKSDANLLDGNLSQLTAYLNEENTAPSVLRIFIEVSNSEPQLLVDLLPKAHSQHSQQFLPHSTSLHQGLTAALGSPVQAYHGPPGSNIGYHNLVGPGGYSRVSHTLPSGATLSACASTSTSATSTPNGGGSGSQQQLFGSSRPSLTSSHTGLGGPSATTHLFNGSLQTLGLALRNNTSATAAPSNTASGTGHVGHTTHVQHAPIHRSLGALGSRAVLYATNGNGHSGLKGSGNRLGVGLSHGGTVVGSGASSARSASASISVLVEESLLDSVVAKDSLGEPGTFGGVGKGGNNGGQALPRRPLTDKQAGSGFQLRVSTFGRNRLCSNNNNNNIITADSKGPDRETDDEDGVESPTNEKSRLVTTSGLGTGGVPFEPLRDAVQHFSEKHLDKIRAFMAGVFARLPLPLKCTIEERHSGKKYAKLHFGCQGKGGNCLYDRTLFASKTKHPRLWIHLMFLAVQARSPLALGQRDPSLAALRHCWDSLRPADGRSFLALVTSAFPSAKDMECLMNELRSRRFLDVFEYNGALQMWACFLCNHPDRAHGFLQESLPVIEGQLKEKRRRWKLFRQWRTKYFTLSGANLSCRELSSDSKEQSIGEVQSVRAIQGRNRHIPKAFEIFTADDKAFVLKAASRRHTEEWVQCLSIALARTHASAGQPGGQSLPAVQNVTAFSCSGQQQGSLSTLVHQHQNDRDLQGFRDNNKDHRSGRDHRDCPSDHQAGMSQVHQVQTINKAPQVGVLQTHQITQRL
ncbi:ventricular zone-expressed PH domain-containing protein homolog 1-like isoform X2 [Varroa destructor]|uniref:PH domain-containing protein n=1 Tax=Varroa destructor TaxID=109461 RepID=A0A7M7KFN4_VARDE|nr:ventricular zone-expressed PH domain-containing protein homolog 1-like isoform X2 [Varroa destructor]